MEKHYFSLNLKELSRNTKKKEWKSISRFLRVTRNEIEKKIPIKKLGQCLIDTMIYGTNTLKL